MTMAKLRIFDEQGDSVVLDMLDERSDFAGISVCLNDAMFLPGVALMFGWLPCHAGTDGTVDCPVCETPAERQMNQIRDHLRRSKGAIAQDIGYSFDDCS